MGEHAKAARAAREQGFQGGTRGEMHAGVTDLMRLQSHSGQAADLAGQPLCFAPAGSLAHLGQQRQAAELRAHGDDPAGESASPDEAEATIDPPVPGKNAVGFIDHGDGSNIRTGPAESGGRPLTDRPLPPASRVFVSGHHPDSADWLSV